MNGLRIKKQEPVEKPAKDTGFNIEDMINILTEYKKIYGNLPLYSCLNKCGHFPINNIWIEDKSKEDDAEKLPKRVVIPNNV